MNQIFKNAISYSIGNYMSKLIAILIFPIIVTYLGLEDTGKLDLIISTVMVLTIVFSLHIGDAIYRWFNTQNQEERQISFSNGIVILAIMILLVVIFYVFAYYFYPYPKELLTISCLILVSQIIYSVFLQIVRGVGNVTRFTIVGIVKSIIFTSVSLLAVIFTENKLYNTLLGLLAANITCTIFSIWGLNFTAYFRRHFINLSNARKLINYSIPLILNALSWTSFFTINKYIILSNLGLYENGVFAVTEKLATGVFFIGMFYYFSVQDHCLSSLNFEKERVFFKKIIVKVMLISGGSMLMIVAGAWIIMPIFFPKLVASLDYLIWLATANFFIILASYFGVPYNYKKQTLSMALTSFVGVVISIVLSLLLVSTYAVHGVCISILIGAVFVFVARLKYTLVFFKA